MSNLVFTALFSEIDWETIVHMLELRERTKGIGDGVIEGYRYIISKRGDKISVILPDYEPREKCYEVVKNLFSKLAPKTTIQIMTLGHASSHCNYCLQPTPLPYRCYRCSGWYCEGHRLPERHNCPGDKRMAEKAVVQPREGDEKEKKSETVVVEVPCG